MGNLITLTGGDKRDPVEIFLDFENAQPSDDEKATFEVIAKVLDRSPAILQKLSNYTGCEEFIRKAITTPGPETEDEVLFGSLMSMSFTHFFSRLGKTFCLLWSN
jgi:hypothetical protein